MKLFVVLFLCSMIGALAAPTDKSLDNFFREKTKIENPIELRDPFKAPPIKANRKKVGPVSAGGPSYTKNEKGEFANIQEVPLAGVDIYNIKLMGVLIGKERRAMISPGGDGKQIVVIKEGAKLGPDNAEVKAILPGGIVLVEKIVNVYGQEEYLETVIPISR